MLDADLEQLKTIKPGDLLSDNVFDQVKVLAVRYINDIYIGESAELYRLLSNLLAKTKGLDNHPDMIQQYNLILGKLGWVALPFIDDADMALQLQQNLFLGINLEIDFIDKIKSLMNLFSGDTNSQDRCRLLFLKALQANQERLGKRSLIIEGEKEIFSPLVKNWLKDYDLFTTLEARRRGVGLLEYMSTNRNVRQLLELEKASLRKILQLYDYLRIIDLGKKIVKPTGHSLEVDEDLKFKTRPSEPHETTYEQSILLAYQGDSKQIAAITNEENKISKKFGADIAKLRDEFYRMVQTKNLNATIAILRLLAQKDDLLKFIQEDEKLKKFLTQTWAKQYGQELVAEFAANPAQPKFVRLFLQYILQQRLGMSSSDAARIGMQIGNILVGLGQKEYNKMAYFEVASKSFKWFVDSL